MIYTGRGRHYITKRREEILKEVIREMKEDDNIKDDDFTAENITKYYLLKTDIPQDKNLIQTKQEFDSMNHRLRATMINTVRYILEKYDFIRKKNDKIEPWGKVIYE